MSKIGKNIRKIRVVKQLSQAAFAQIFNLARPSVGAYEEGRSEPKIDTVVQMAQYFGLSVDALLTKELTINDLYRFDALKNKKLTQAQKEEIPENKEARGNTIALFLNRKLEYIHNRMNSDFIDQLPRYHFPWISSDHARAFETEGDFIHNDPQGSHPGDMVICEIKINTYDTLIPGNLYVLVTEENIIVRRFKSLGATLVFSSDNSGFSLEEFEPGQVLELWQVYAAYSRTTGAILEIKDRIVGLEERYILLSGRMDDIEKSRGNNP